MRARTWPVLRLVFPAPLDDGRRERLLLDVDDCNVSALDEDGDIVSLYFSAAPERDAALDLLASRGWLSQATLATEDVPDEGWAARSQANLPAIRVGRIIVAPPWDLPTPDARTICWSSKSSLRPDSGPDTTRPRDSACRRCRHSICEALASSTSARAPVCWPLRPPAWAQPRRSGSTTTRMRSNRPRTRCAAMAWGQREPSAWSCADSTIQPSRQRTSLRQPHRCPAPAAGCTGAGAARAGWPRGAQRLHRRRSPLGPRDLRCLRRRGDVRRRVLDRLRVAPPAGRVPGVAHDRQRGERHLLGPQRHRRHRPGCHPASSRRHFFTVHPPSGPIARQTPRRRQDFSGVALRGRRLREPQTRPADTAVSTSISATGRTGAIRGSTARPHCLADAMATRSHRSCAASAARTGTFVRLVVIGQMSTAPSTVASRITASIASPFSSPWATMIGAGVREPPSAARRP